MISEVEIRKNVLTGHKFTDFLKSVFPRGITMIHENLNFLAFYNHGHNILRIFGTLPNFLFTTSETKRDY